MKIFLAIVFIYCFYAFFYCIKVGYDFLKSLNSRRDVYSNIGSLSTLNSQKSPEIFIRNVNILLYSSYFLILFSGWLVYKLYPWWVILITVLFGNFISNSRKIEPALFREHLIGAKRTFFVGLIIIVTIFIVWLRTNNE